MLVYDVTSEKTFDNIRNWIRRGMGWVTLEPSLSLSIRTPLNSGHLYEQDTFICLKCHICVLNNL